MLHSRKTGVLGSRELELAGPGVVLEPVNTRSG